MSKKKILTRDWKKRVLGALNTIKKTAEKQEYEATHTVDGKKIKIGLKVFILDDPTIQWSISETEERIFRISIALEAEGQETIKRHPTKLFVNHKKAIHACILDIRNTQKIILRDMEESVKRLDPINRIKELRRLKRKLDEN